MAISQVVYGKTQFRFAFVEETTFGTPVSVASLLQECHITEPPTLDTATAVIVDETPRIDGSAVLSTSDIYKTTGGAITSVTVTGILTTPVLEMLLEGVFQNKSTSTSEDTYEWGPDTSALGDGADQTFFTLALHDPASGKGKRVTSAFLKTLEISWEPGSNGGRASFSATFISGLPLEYDQDFTPASWSSPGTSFFTTSGLDAKRVDSNDVVLGSFSLSLDNGATFYGCDTSGYAEGCAVGASGKGYVASGNVSVKYDENTNSLITKALTNPTGGTADIPITLTFNSGDAINQVAITANAVLDSANLNYGGSAGVMLDLPFKCAWESTTSGLTIVVGDNTPS